MIVLMVSRKNYLTINLLRYVFYQCIYMFNSQKPKIETKQCLSSIDIIIFNKKIYLFFLFYRKN